MENPQPTRRPYTGSCHCGKTRYIVFLTMPHAAPSTPELHMPGQKMYKCNCTNCHKAGYLHLRLEQAARDFLLLAPLDPHGKLGLYRWNTEEFNFFFCPTCGGKCFAYCGQTEVADVPLAELADGAFGFGGDGADEDALKGTFLGGENVNISDGKIKVWRGKQGVFDEGKRMGWMTVNALTLDAGQGLDLREWHDKGWILYLDGLNNMKGQPRYGKPHEGGVY